MLIIYDFGMNFEMYIFIFFAYADATNSSYNTFFFFLANSPRCQQQVLVIVLLVDLDM